MTKEELIVKIKKLQAMSESSNPNEAAMALSRIQKLMETYSLEASDLDEGSIGEICLYPVTGLKDLSLAGKIGAILEKALGNDKANAVLNKLTASIQVKPFESVFSSTQKSEYENSCVAPKFLDCGLKPPVQKMLITPSSFVSTTISLLSPILFSLITRPLNLIRFFGIFFLFLQLIVKIVGNKSRFDEFLPMIHNTHILCWCFCIIILDS